MKSRMTIGRKISVCFTLLMAVAVAFGALSWLSIGKLGRMQDELVQTQMRQLALAHEVNLGAERLRGAQRGFVGDAVGNSVAGMAEHKREFEASLAETEKKLTELRSLPRTGGNGTIESAQSALRECAATFNEVVRRVSAGDVKSAGQLENEKGTELADVLDKAGDLMISSAMDEVGIIDKETDRVRDNNLMLMTGALGLLVCVSIGAAWVIRQVNTSLLKIVAQLTEGAGQVASAATQVSSSSQSLAQGANEQAAAIEQTSASGDEMRATISQTGENTRRAAESVAKSQQQFVQTNQSLEQMVHAMDEINTHSGKISKILKVIDEIAFQTNILALNAAVEAARAGEAGMGFAVVAEEVRSLAQRCAQAARDTAALIDESMAKSTEGKTRVDQVAAAIRVITGEFSHVKDMVDAVSERAEEQTHGVEQVAKAISEIERVTQTAAASAEQSAAAAEELTSQSESLKGIVDDLKQMVDASASR